jgi:hypothetical protein
MGKKKRNPKNNQEGEDMLAVRKNNASKNCINYTPAKTSDVTKAIMKSNKKHSKMMNMLAK